MTPNPGFHDPSAKSKSLATHHQPNLPSRDEMPKAVAEKLFPFVKNECVLERLGVVERGRMRSE
jgi:hypothetical protein